MHEAFCMLQKDNVFSSKSFSLTLGSRIFGRRAQPLATWGTGRMWSFHVWNKHWITHVFHEVSWCFMFVSLRFCSISMNSCFSLHVFFVVLKKVRKGETQQNFNWRLEVSEPWHLGPQCVRSVSVAVPALCFIVPIVARASDHILSPKIQCIPHAWMTQGLPLGVPEGVTVPRARRAWESK